MELFAVFKAAVYRHECGGIFSSLELATEAAKTLAAGERDDHHRYEVVPFRLDEMTPQSPVSSPLQGRPSDFYCGGELEEAEAIIEFTRKGPVDRSPTRPIAKNITVVNPDEGGVRIKS